MCWAGPVHGHRGGVWDIPNRWTGADPASLRVMRFPSPAAAHPALDSVFAPGSHWTLAHGGRPIRIVTVPPGPAHPIHPDWPSTVSEELTALASPQAGSGPRRLRGLGADTSHGSGVCLVAAGKLGTALVA
jgi:hypothetical protein